MANQGKKITELPIKNNIGNNDVIPFVVSGGATSKINFKDFVNSVESLLPDPINTLEYDINEYGDIVDTGLIGLHSDKSLLYFKGVNKDFTLDRIISSGKTIGTTHIIIYNKGREKIKVELYGTLNSHLATAETIQDENYIPIEIEPKDFIKLDVTGYIDAVTKMQEFYIKLGVNYKKKDFVPAVRRINNKPLINDIILLASDIDLREYAKKTDIPYKFKGYYTNLSELKVAHPELKELAGDNAWVGLPYPGTVYRIITNGGVWTDTGEIPKQDPIDLGEYAKKKDVVNKTVIYNISQIHDKYDFANKLEARTLVDDDYKFTGQILVYKLNNGKWVTEQFNGESIILWSEDLYWNNIGVEVTNEKGTSKELAVSQDLFTKNINKKADGGYIQNGFLHLTSEGIEIATPIEIGNKGILNITEENNGLIFNNSEMARNRVKQEDRKPGQLISYELINTGWMIEMFNSSNPSLWGEKSNWVRLLNTIDLDKLDFDINEIQQSVSSIIEELNVKVDGGYIEDGENEGDPSKLILTANGEPVAEMTLPSGGGGGGTSDVTMRLRSIGSTTIVVAEKDRAYVEFEWSSVYNDSKEETGGGSLQVIVNNVSVINKQITQGSFKEEVTKFLNTGTNIVKVRITDSVNNTRTLNYNINKALFYLESSFDTDMVYDKKPIAFRYTPYGAGQKTIKFWLNDVELPSETTTSSGKQMVKHLDGVIAGVNTLKVIAETDINGFILESNELYIQIAFVDETVVDPLITSSFNIKEANQHSKITIPYFVYDPMNEIAHVSLLVNGVQISSLNAPRQAMYWDYILTEVGTINLSIQCKSTIKNFEIKVNESDIEITEETANLEYKAFAIGKTNADSNKDDWSYNGYNTKFNNFFWLNDGWQKDKYGNNSLLFLNNANIDINIKPFTSSVTNEGLTLTLEYSTENVISNDVRIIECMNSNIGFFITPNKIELHSSQSQISAMLDSSEKTSISFVVEKRTDDQLIMVYINGIMSGTINYPNGDNFLQLIQQPIHVSTGNKNCNVRLYGIRWYKNNLNYNQILGNYVYDIESLDEKLIIHDRNQILDPYGKIDYDKALNYLPVMTIIGDLPQWKGNKKPNTKFIYEDRQNPSYSFTAEGVENDVQGTSSQYYPRRNYKFKFKNGLTLTETQEKLQMYSLRGGVPAKEFTVKADFAESSGTHNTGMAIIVEDMMKNMGKLTPPQKVNPNVRTTVDGYPILILHKASDTAEAEFIGKYNFNNDKASEQVFGFTPGCESWEFRNNFTDLCLFKSADWESTYIDKNGKEMPVWTQDIEGRYPDSSMDISNVRKVFDWVISCKGNTAKFKSEVKNWFKLDELLFYWIITETFGMVDQRAKNQFLTTYGERGATGELLWQFIFYDNDTCLGINNEGRMEFNYNIETEDVQGTAHIWNGWDSELWILVKDAFYNEIAALYSDIRNKGYLSVDKVLKVLEKDQAEKWAQQVYNQDGYYKYIAPLTEGFWDYSESNENPSHVKTAEYLYALQGSRSEHRRMWVKNRLRYMDSRFKSGSYNNDKINMRIYTPAAGEWGGVPPNSDFDLVTNDYGYIHVSYGSDSIVTPSQKVVPNGTYHFTAGGASLNDTETAIHGVSMIKSFGDLSSKYAGTVNFSMATSLRELILGSTATGYRNTNLKTLDVSSNIMLEKINVANCVDLVGALDLSKCTQVVEVEAKGSKITSVNTSKSGIMKKLSLPSTVTNLILRNQPEFETLQVQGYENINSLYIANVKNLDGYNLLKTIGEIPNNKLIAFRLEGVNIREENAGFLYKMAKLYGLDDNGNILPNPSSAIVKGYAFFDTITREAYNLFLRQFPELEIDYINIVETTIEFQDSIVEGICLSRWDANDDGFLSPSEVRNKQFPQNILGGTGAKYFNELHYFSEPPAKHIINICNTLEEVSFIPGTATFELLNNLKKLTLYPTLVDSPTIIPFGKTDIKTCPNLAELDVSGRYYTNADGNQLLYKITNNGVDHLENVLPLPNVSDIVVHPENDIDLIYNMDNTYSHDLDIKTIDLANVKGFSMNATPNVEFVRIRNLSKHTNSTFYFEGTSGIWKTKNIIIDSKPGDKELTEVKLRNSSATGIVNATFTITDAVKCNYTEGSVLQFMKGGISGKTIDVVDLGENYKPLIIIFNTNITHGIPKFIIRSKTILSRIGVFSGTVYVPDELVEAYKQTEWKTNQIYGLSQL